MKRLWFIFHEGDIVLERLSDGSCSVPKGEQPPIATTKQTHILNVSPMDNGDEVKAFMTETLPADHARYEMCSLRNSFYRLPSNAKSSFIGTETPGSAECAALRWP